MVKTIMRRNVTYLRVYTKCSMETRIWFFWIAKSDLYLLFDYFTSDTNFFMM